MAGEPKGCYFFRKPRQSSKPNQRCLKRKREEDELERLEKAIAKLDLKEFSKLKKFTDLPLSNLTAAGLRVSHFHSLKDVQARVIPLALRGADILAAAKTGSGKTLAFLVPLLEKLFRKRWSREHGVGALVVSPTRELSEQIMAELKRIGQHHDFSAALLVGGNSVRKETEVMDRINIVIGTPGRILQHLEQSPGFNVDYLQMLVLDEADRLMDDGFERDVNAIIEYLPRTRQTLLFSATQSRKASDLARLGLHDPEFISVDKDAPVPTPATLRQSYYITPLPDKLEYLWAFVKKNSNSKILVFLSSCKQVRFVYELFKHMQPGCSVHHLHGHMSPKARRVVLDAFKAAPQACLLATDIAARGLDIPALDWVVQVDVPEDVDTYIHRAGRAGRNGNPGKAVIFIDLSEAAFINKLESKKIPIQKRALKVGNDVAKRAQDLCFKDFKNFKPLARAAFKNYAKSILIQKDKDVFKFDELDFDTFAKNLGLPSKPEIKLSKSGQAGIRAKNMSRAEFQSDSDTEDPDTGMIVKKKRRNGEVRTKFQKMSERQNQDVLSSNYNKWIKDDDDVDANEDFLSVKRVHRHNKHNLDAGEPDAPSAPAEQQPKIVKLGKLDLVIDSNRREKLLKSKKKIAKLVGRGQKLVFDDDGTARPLYTLTNEDDLRKEGDIQDLRNQFVEAEMDRVREQDVQDRQVAKEKSREKKLKRKARECWEEAANGGRTAVQLVGYSEDESREDPLALLRSLPVADSDGAAARDEEARRPKKQRKWFLTSDDEVDGHERSKKSKCGKKVVELDHEPETLDDFEALAAGLLEE